MLELKPSTLKLTRFAKQGTLPRISVDEVSDSLTPALRIQAHQSHARADRRLPKIELN